MKEYDQHEWSKRGELCLEKFYILIFLSTYFYPKCMLICFTDFLYSEDHPRTLARWHLDGTDPDVT